MALLSNPTRRTFTPELYKQKCSALFEHVYEKYPERDVVVYAGVW